MRLVKYPPLRRVDNNSTEKGIWDIAVANRYLRVSINGNIIKPMHICTFRYHYKSILTHIC